MINNRKLKDNEDLFDEYDPRWKEWLERLTQSNEDQDIAQKEFEIATAKVLEYGGVYHVPKEKSYLVDEYFAKKAKFEQAIEEGDKLCKECEEFRDYMMGGKPDTDILS